MDREYVILDNQKRPAHPFKDGGKSWDEVKNFDNIAMIVPESFVVLDFDTKSDADIMLKIVEGKDLHCKVMKTDRGYHFWFRSTESLKNFVKGRLAIGIYCDRKTSGHNAYVKIKGNGKMREWIRDYEEDDVDYLPSWLYPVSTSSNNFKFKGMGEGDGRNQQLYSYIAYLQDNGFKKTDVLMTLDVINRYVFDESLSDREMYTICRDEAFKSEEQIEEDAKKHESKDEFKFRHEQFAQLLLEEFNIISVNRNLYIYQNGYYKPDRDDIEMLMIKIFEGIKDSQRQEVLKYLKISTNKTKEVESATVNPYIININNGRLNLLTGELMEHSPEYYDFCRIPITYNPDAECKILDDTLSSIFIGDKEVLDLVEEVIGVCLLKEAYAMCFLFYGSGSNGKSTFFYLLRKFLGDENVSSIEMDKLGARFQTAELEHKLANIGDDLNYTGIKNNGTIKKLISGDAVQVERKNEKPYSFVSYATQIFATNELPRSTDKTDGMMRRLCFIPCLAKFGQNGIKKNPKIKFEITTEEAFSHLLNRAIRGLRRLLSNGDFTTPKIVTEAKESYRIENSTVLSWVEDESITLDTIKETSAINLYLRFDQWCKLTNVKEITGKKTFNKEIIQYFDLDKNQKKKRTENGYARFFVTKLDEL